MDRRKGRWTRRAAGLLSLGFALSVHAEEIVRNWFNDPYFQVRAAIPDCPTPLGPYGTEGDRMRETHYRLERGLRCYLEKKCSKPSSYMYDADIAAEVKSRFEQSPLLRDASLWVTAQRRFVWVEGCVTSPRAKGEIEGLLKGVADLEQVIVNVWPARQGVPPYRTFGPGQRRID